MTEQTIWDEPSAEQRELLHGIHELWSPQGKWPGVLDLTRWLRLNTDIRMSARDIMESFPVVGDRGAFFPSYSAIWFDPRDHGDSATVRLTPAAGLVCSEFRPIAEAYVQVIRIGAEKVVWAAPGSGSARITSDELHTLLDDAYRLFIPHIPDMVQHEPANLYQSIGVPDDWKAEFGEELSGRWVMELSEKLAEYDGVESLKEYVEKTLELMPSPFSSVFAMNSVFTGVERVSAPQVQSVFYVNQSLIDELDALPQTKWNLQKLVALLRELNANYASGHPYACLMLCRALLDYVPPVFGVRKFSEVLNNATGMSETDKKYLKMLGTNRLAADDVLHRQMRRSADLIDMHYLPPNAAMDAFVRVLIDRIAEDA